ncbi:hypothetical protein SUGI_0591710 [Cryptomeria japonica]|nr:hypothetical protein SUGI_0591710 [Cryptomeria japonica]
MGGAIPKKFTLQANRGKERRRNGMVSLQKTNIPQVTLGKNHGEENKIEEGGVVSLRLSGSIFLTFPRQFDLPLAHSCKPKTQGMNGRGVRYEEAPIKFDFPKSLSYHLPAIQTV